MKMTETTVPLSSDTVNQAIQYIELHLLEKITPDDIATEIYVNVTTLNILFKTLIGMTVMEYIRSRRLSMVVQELLTTESSIIELSYQYGYETPEAFTKAFTRCYGISPSVLRRIRKELPEFQPIEVSVQIQGGWTEHKYLTESFSTEQDCGSSICYSECIKQTGGIEMREQEVRYHVNTSEMKESEDWETLLALAKALDQAKIKFKVDGKTMIFAHGLEFPLEKICLTFCWSEDEKIKSFFNYEGEDNRQISEDFKCFDAKFRNKKIRCMFYNDLGLQSDEENLYHYAEPVEIDHYRVMVQSLEFYYNNAEKDTELYQRVKDYLKK